MPASQLLFVAAALASLLLSIGTAAAALRAPRLRFRPLWALLALVGVGGAAMVVARPDRLYWFLGVALPTASFAAADGGWRPELVRALFPAGALVVLARLHRLRAPAQGTGEGH